MQNQQINMGKLFPIIPFVDLVHGLTVKNPTVAEIGVYDGSTTMHYIDKIIQTQGRLFVVDWFNGNVDAGPGIHQYDEEKADSVFYEFLSNIHRAIPYTTILRGKSHDMIPLIPDKSLDICFIDADHRYEGVYKDIDLCMPKIKPGGIICGHDCNNYHLANTFDREYLKYDCHPDGNHYGVIQAVYEHFGDDVLIIGDKYGQNNNVWVKKL